MPKLDHYAIVIGLARYLRLGDPPPANLNGSENDADAVLDWLVSPTGGDLPPGNIKTIRSREYPAGEARPTRDELDEAFLWLDSLAQVNNDAGKKRAVGMRLYFYVAGHGFSPRVKQACLLAGNAAEKQYSANIFASEWISWLQDAEYFREFVLWMDSCMDRQILTSPSAVPLNPILAGTAPGPTFVAFAASRPLKAVEKPIPEDSGKWHGTFTWNLLQGLRGAAANRFGAVTGRALADWLRQSQIAWLDEAERRNPDIAKEPSFGAEDDSLVFVRGVAPFDFDVTLQFPDTAIGKTGRIWSGVPPKPNLTFTVSALEVPVRLKPGLYLADVLGTNLRHGFAVTRSGEISLSDTGDPVVEGTGIFNLKVDPNDETAEVQLVGDEFRTVDFGNARLQSRLPCGLYQMRVRIGRQIVEKVILLDADWPKPTSPTAATESLPKMPKITSAAPLDGTRATHEYHRSAVSDAQGRIDVTAGTGAQLMIMVRTFSEGGKSIPDAKPWEGVSVVDENGNILADMANSGAHIPGNDPSSTCTLEIAPGAYALRYTIDGVRVAQSLILPPHGWRLEAYLLRNLDSTQKSAERARVSLLMRQIGFGGSSTEDLLLEKARVALADERPILSDALSALLLKKFNNPLAGIIGGHLLLIAQEQGRRDQELELLNLVVQNLRNLVGPGHPDVEALSLACPNFELRTISPFKTAPLFERSWRMIVQASQSRSDLVPISLWQRVYAKIDLPPFMMWSPDPADQASFRSALAENIFGQRAESRSKEIEIPLDETYARELRAQPAFHLSLPASEAIAETISLGTDIGMPALPNIAVPVSFGPATPPILKRRIVERAAALGLPPVAVAALQDDYLARLPESAASG